MNIIQNYIIMHPFQLPWRFVSPAHFKGLDYHLSPDLTIRLEGLYSSTVRVNEKNQIVSDPEDMELLVGVEIFTSYSEDHFNATGLNAERIFNNEIMSAKSKERINKAFADKNDQLTCFFTESQMNHFQELFESTFYFCSSVTVLYNGKEINDIAELPQKEYKLALAAFAELQVQATIDYKKSKEELEGAYSEYLEKKVAKEDVKQQQSILDRLKNKGVKKGILKAFGALAVGSISWLVKRKLIDSGGWVGSVAAVLIGVAGVGFELYGRQQTQTILRGL
ncbi:hypothetical protein [Priestia megaterium]|uniref:hypothetical protein n=1 Tax=Priestia megaterium TaxID=1404 RepID=UPI000BFB5F64|nr:hypothetical protein [Priestia megaterium]PGQ88243.1 hypothetical protein COA18_04770 [Priestia megaterium]